MRVQLSLSHIERRSTYPNSGESQGCVNLSAKCPLFRHSPPHTTLNRAYSFWYPFCSLVIVSMKKIFEKARWVNWVSWPVLALILSVWTSGCGRATQSLHNGLIGCSLVFWYMGSVTIKAKSEGAFDDLILIASKNGTAYKTIPLNELGSFPDTPLERSYSLPEPWGGSDSYSAPAGTYSFRVIDANENEVAQGSFSISPDQVGACGFIKDPQHLHLEVD